MVSTITGVGWKTTMVDRKPPITLSSRTPRRGPTARPENLSLVVHSVVKGAETSEAAAQRLEDLPLPGGAPGLPFVGNALELFRDDPQKVILRYHEKYGNIYRTNIYGRKSIVIWGADNIQEVLLGESSRNIKCEMIGTAGKLFGPNALTNQPADKHIALRKLLGPFFSPKAGEKYVPFIVERANKCCERCVTLGTFSWFEEMQKYAFITVTDAVLGITFPGRSFDEVLDLLQTWMNGLFTIGINLPFTKFGKAMWARSQLLEIIQNAVDVMEAAPKDDDLSKKALKQLIDARDEQGNALSREDIGDVMLTLLFAGFDTTANTLAQLICELSRHPEVWEKLRAEQRQIIETFGDEITPEALNAMSYADAVLKEILRLGVVVSSVSRRITKTFEMGGYKIPAGWGLILQTGLSTRYRDDKWKDDVDEFKPERFYQEGAAKGAYMPWGLGPHLCIGKVIAELETKVMLALLARKYVVVLENPNVDPRQFRVGTAAVDRLQARIERLREVLHH